MYLVWLVRSMEKGRDGMKWPGSLCVESPRRQAGDNDSSVSVSDDFRRSDKRLTVLTHVVESYLIV